MPNSLWMSVATRLVVHTSPRKPYASAPCANSVGNWVRCSAVNFGVGPGGMRTHSASGPPSRARLSHWLTAPSVTPKAWAIARPVQPAWCNAQARSRRHWFTAWRGERSRRAMLPVYPTPPHLYNPAQRSVRDLRDFLRLLEEQGDLVHITRPVSPVYGVAAGIRRTSDVKGPALWFDDVEGASMPVVGGLYAHRRRALWGLETTAEEFFGKYMRGLSNPIPPRVVSDAPCQEVVLTGDDANLDRLPICTHNRLDAAPFITMGLTIARHPEYGTNVSISRMQRFDGQTLGIMSVPPQQIGVYFQEAEARGESLPLAVAIGNDPYTTLCSQVPGGIYLDEFAVAGGWLGEPVDLVRCVTSDVLVPATSEIVLEAPLAGDQLTLEDDLARRRHQHI